jgi:integrase
MKGVRVHGDQLNPRSSTTSCKKSPGEQARVLLGQDADHLPAAQQLHPHLAARHRVSGLTGFHIHDLRHTGNYIAAATGAGLRELMGRMGHSTARAALIYQHRMGAGDENRTRTISLGSGAVTAVQGR